MTHTDLRKWSDAGVPLIWSMYVTSEIEMQAHNETAHVAKKVAQFKPAKKAKINEKDAHVRLIIGYKEKTLEVACSDSWGPEHEERWMTMESAKRVSSSEALNAITW